MKTIIVFCLFFMIYAASADPCSYNYCVKDELHVCKESKDRQECNARGGLYVTYKTGLLATYQHKCCMFTLAQIPEKHLYCVRNIRSVNKKCTSDSVSKYEFKYKSKNECRTFSCE